MKIFTASIIIATAFLVAWIRHRVDLWTKWVDNLNHQLLTEPIVTSSNPYAASLEDLPPVVQTYLQKVLPSTSPTNMVHSVKIHQEGHFLFGASWVPFEASQTIRGVSPPGFVWDATISMTPRFQQKDLQKSLLPTMQVCDALVDGGKQAYLRAALVNVFDSIHAKSTIDEEDDEAADEDQFLWVGEAMRWLAEAVMVPTALLPEQGLVEWSALPGQEHRAMLRLKDFRASTSSNKVNHHLEAVNLQVEFDPETGFITQVSGARPYEREVLDEQGDLFPIFTRKKTSWEWRRWVGRLSDYTKVAGGMYVPQRMEAGWMEGDELELYFKGFNEAMEYKLITANASGRPSKKKPVAEAVIPNKPDAASSVA
ncbi:MAG: hypothetical protein SGILL_010036 [Bacillariaceae sp.]